MPMKYSLQKCLGLGDHVGVHSKCICMFKYVWTSVNVNTKVNFTTNNTATL